MENNVKQIYPAAVALRYRSGRETAPRLTAKGKGAVAEKILETAKENDIPILQSPELLEALMTVELEDSIPDTAFSAVAEIYAFLIELDKGYEKILD